MAPDIALDQLRTAVDGAQPLIVLDPMCGSGTVLSASTSRGHSACGYDVDPLAVLMSTVATQPVDTFELIAEAERVLLRAMASKSDVPRWNDPETVKFAEYWFGNEQRTQLNRLSLILDDVQNTNVRQALQIALSRIIVTKSPKASLAADTSHSRPHRVVTKSSYDVFRGFTSSVSNLSKLLDQRESCGNVVVERGDARSINLGANSVDLIITSPPYLNAIDYLRGHKMSLIWLGHTIPALRRIRSDSIGSERALDSDVVEQVEEMVQSIRVSVRSPDKLPVKTITRYAHDLTLFAAELYRVCRPGGKVVTVIGNSTLRGNYIQNDLLVGNAYQNAGFHSMSRTERELPENRRYLPMNTRDLASPMAKRMRTEVVLTVEKAQ